MEANRLANESSPYLLQHAHNPVDWYPWGEAAFARAGAENKPIFLSIGYATCHWCHVMERESFEDEDVAALLNRDFVCIKVDREERPDIDAVYMTVTQAMTGRGGWPMTIVMTPEKKPFFAGTYFPKESRPGRGIGILELLPALAKAWREQPDDVRQTADRVTQGIASGSTLAAEDLPAKILDTAETHLAAAFDADHGGFGSAPKFPTPQNLVYLLRRYSRRRDRKLLDMVETTLLAMRLGGVYDHIGFGFHRYSTDSRWLVPHFEKMLYDQALLAIAYLEAYQVTGNDLYARTAREIFRYVQRDLTDPAGGFYSAEDADSEGEEGKFYLWRRQELKDLLGNDADGFIQAYGVVAAGNYNDEATGRKSGANILHLSDSKDIDRFENQRSRLLQERTTRPRPLLDDKILTDWNGLMIAALSRGAQVLDEPAYAAAATRAADFVLTRLRRRTGELMKRFRRGKAGLPAHLEDYAFLVWGLLELYEARLETAPLKAALELSEIMIRQFRHSDGGFYLTAADSEALPYRHIDFYDGAIPSGNAVAAANLLRLAHMTGREDLRDEAHGIFRAAAGRVKAHPRGYLALLSARDFAAGPVREIVIAGDPEDDGAAAMIKAIRQHYLPRRVLLLHRPDDRELAAIAPYIDPLRPIDGNAAAYICENHTCALPVGTVREMLENLGVGKP